MFNMLAENNKKLHSILKDQDSRPATTKAESMLGDGDLPPKPSGMFEMKTEPLQNAGDFVHKEVGSVDALPFSPPPASSADLPGVALPTFATYGKPLSTKETEEHFSKTQDKQQNTIAEVTRKRKRNNRETESIPLVSGQAWYYLGPPSSHSAASSSDEEEAV